jgi:lipid-binding SYLF domain-containing protein
MKRAIVQRAIVLSLILPALALPVFAASAKKVRKKIDKGSKASIERLFEESPEARALYDEAYAYATFDGTEAALLISSGGGKGVAVEKASGRRVYMRVASAGVGIGVGFQTVQTVFLFEDRETFEGFVETGWDADASGSAAAGQEGLNAKSSFTGGMMVYQMTKKGLIAQASVKGTKYWKDEKLNG